MEKHRVAKLQRVLRNSVVAIIRFIEEDSFAVKSIHDCLHIMRKYSEASEFLENLMALYPDNIKVSEDGLHITLEGEVSEELTNDILKLGSMLKIFYEW